MAQLTVRYKHKGMMARLPRQIRLNGQSVGVLQHREARITLPAGNYFLTVAFGGPLRIGKKTIDLSVSTTEPVRAEEGAPVTVEFSDRERIWNILFDIDLVLWLAEFFITLPEPWGLVYKIASDAFFAVWMLRIWLIRKKYYKFNISREQS